MMGALGQNADVASKMEALRYAVYLFYCTKVQILTQKLHVSHEVGKGRDHVGAALVLSLLDLLVHKYKY
jgi:hypothetical protein